MISRLAVSRLRGFSSAVRAFLFATALMGLLLFMGTGCAGESRSGAAVEAGALGRLFAAHRDRVIGGAEPFVATGDRFTIPLRGEPGDALLRRHGLTMSLPKRGSPRKSPRPKIGVVAAWSQSSDYLARPLTRRQNGTLCVATIASRVTGFRIHIDTSSPSNPPGEPS